MPCPQGSFAPVSAATTCSVCGAGNYSANILSCLPCAIGEYCLLGSSVGTACPQHYTTLYPGAASDSECVCKPNRFQSYTNASTSADGSLIYDARQCDECPSLGQKLVLGYELRTFYYELVECARKLAIVCLPVFFQPSGSVSQLIFGLLVCFATFGALQMLAPYASGADDWLARFAQVQIFFALLSSVALKYDASTISNATNMDVLLSALTLIPILLTPLLDSPVSDCVADEANRAKLVEALGFRAICVRLRALVTRSSKRNRDVTSSASHVEISTHM